MAAIIERSKTNLTNGQATNVEMNLGKRVSVRLLSGEVVELTIHGGINLMEAFKYVMHTAKRPRKEFYYLEGADSVTMHSNIRAGYYFVDPLSIIL
jgi:hypothetical protein